MIAAQSFGCQEQMGHHPNEFPASRESVAKVKIKCQGNSFSADTENGVELGWVGKIKRSIIMNGKKSYNVSLYKFKKKCCLKNSGLQKY